MYLTNSSQLWHPISFGGGCFQFFTKNWPQKQQKRAILHTLQANGGDAFKRFTIVETEKKNH